MIRLGLRYRQGLTLAALSLLAVPLRAQEPVTPMQQREHVVRRGDTLWDLAGHYLGNPFLWPMIYEANRSVVEDPHWIYPGERLLIPGLPVPEAEVIDQQQIETPPPVFTPADTVPAAVLETVDLRRPVIAAAEYRATPWVQVAPERAVIGRIVRVWDPSRDEDRIPTVLHPHYRVHVGQLRQGLPAVGDSLSVVRIGRELRDWGRVVEPLALLRVDSVGSGTILATVIQQYGEARVGDRVIPVEPVPPIPLGQVEAVTDGAEGNLLEFVDEEQIYGTGNKAFVTLGAEQVQLGDELAIYVPGRRIDDERPDVLPPAEVARAVVVRVTERTATVRLTRVLDTAVRAGLPVRVVARVP